MSFEVEIRMPETGSDQTVILAEWLAQPGEYLGWNRPLLRVSIGATSPHVICNMPVVVLERRLDVGVGATSDDLLAFAKAEGDEIPYGKPYARLEF